MSRVLVSNLQRHLRISAAAIRRLTRAVLADLGLTRVELSVVLCDDARIAALNQKYLRRSGPTNVISFSLPVEEGVGVRRLRLLGDVVVNVEQAVRDADDAGVSPSEETAFLLIHGICHLAGYDHEGKRADRAPEMEAVEQKLFERHRRLLEASR